MSDLPVSNGPEIDGPAQVRRIHDEVEERVAAVLARLTFPLVCREGCCDCCLDDLTVFPVEAAVIQENAGDLLQNCEPHPIGRCAFLDPEGACRIYPWRPYVCRTQGLPLQWTLEDETGGETVHRDICPLNLVPMDEAGSDLADLAADQVWRLGEFESRLAALQASVTGFAAQLPRVSLRSLFSQ